MKTYNTYQEAKIANPECEVYVSMNGDFADENHVGYVSMCGTGAGWNKCNPADYCMTVEQFLKGGHEFTKGDIVIDVGKVSVINSSFDVDAYNEPDNGDCNIYILRAAALEKPKQISDTAREVFSTDSIPKIHKDSEFYKKPRTNVEFVKVDDSIWHLEAYFGCGELFAFDGVRDYVQIETEGDFTLSHSSDNLYRRIETPVTEEEALTEALKEIWIIDGCDGEMQIERIVNSGKFKLVN